jgi:hypothetical protein
MEEDGATWLAIMALAATILGIGCGLLSWLGGMNVPNAILAGIGAFGTTLIVMITIRRFTKRDSRHS